MQKIKEFLEELNKAKVNYAVMWGHEKLPEEISGTDIDILIGHSHMNKVFTIAGYVYRFSPVQHPEYTGHHKVDNQIPHSHYLLANFDIWTTFCVNTKEAKIKGPRGERQVLPYDFSELVLRNRVKYKNFYVADPISQAAMTILRVIRDKEIMQDRYKSRIKIGRNENKDGVLKLVTGNLSDAEIADTVRPMLYE